MLLCALAANSPAMAGTPSLNGQDVTVTLQETGYSDVADTIMAGPGGPQIVGNTMDPIGSILFSHESVNVQDLQIVYNIQGGGGTYAGSAPECAGSPGCSLWSAAPDDARFLFSGLNFGTPNTVLASVSLTPTNVYGAQIEDVTATSFEVVFGSAGVLNGTGPNPALGTLTMNLQTEVSAVPEPASVALLLGGMLLLAWRRSLRA